MMNPDGTNSSAKISTVVIPDCGGFESLREAFSKTYGIVLMITEVPTVSVEPMETIVNASEEVHAVCKGYGVPKAKVYWDTSEIESRFEITSLSSNEIELRIFNVTQYDMGNIRCFSENDAGRVNASWMLCVNCRCLEIRENYKLFLDFLPHSTTKSRRAICQAG